MSAAEKRLTFEQVQVLLRRRKHQNSPQNESPNNNNGTPLQSESPHDHDATFESEIKTEKEFESFLLKHSQNPLEHLLHNMQIQFELFALCVMEVECIYLKNIQHQMLDALSTCPTCCFQIHDTRKRLSSKTTDSKLTLLIRDVFRQWSVKRLLTSFAAVENDATSNDWEMARIKGPPPISEIMIQPTLLKDTETDAIFTKVVDVFMEQKKSPNLIIKLKKRLPGVVVCLFHKDQHVRKFANQIIRYSYCESSCAFTQQQSLSMGKELLDLATTIQFGKKNHMTRNQYPLTQQPKELWMAARLVLAYFDPEALKDAKFGLGAMLISMVCDILAPNSRLVLDFDAIKLIRLVFMQLGDTFWPLSSLDERTIVDSIMKSIFMDTFLHSPETSADARSKIVLEMFTHLINSNPPNCSVTGHVMLLIYGPIEDPTFYEEQWKEACSYVRQCLSNNDCSVVQSLQYVVHLIHQDLGNANPFRPHLISVLPDLIKAIGKALHCSLTPTDNIIANPEQYVKAGLKYFEAIQDNVEEFDEATLNACISCYHAISMFYFADNFLSESKVVEKQLFTLIKEIVMHALCLEKRTDDFASLTLLLVTHDTDLECAALNLLRRTIQIKHQRVYYTRFDVLNWIATNHYQEIIQNELCSTSNHWLNDLRLLWTKNHSMTSATCKICEFLSEFVDVLRNSVINQLNQETASPSASKIEGAMQTLWLWAWEFLTISFQYGHQAKDKLHQDQTEAKEMILVTFNLAKNVLSLITPLNRAQRDKIILYKPDYSFSAFISVNVWVAKIIIYLDSDDVAIRQVAVDFLVEVLPLVKACDFKIETGIIERLQQMVGTQPAPNSEAALLNERQRDALSKAMQSLKVKEEVYTKQVTFEDDDKYFNTMDDEILFEVSFDKSTGKLKTSPTSSKGPKTLKPALKSVTSNKSSTTHLQQQIKAVREKKALRPEQVETVDRLRKEMSAAAELKRKAFKIKRSEESKHIVRPPNSKHDLVEPPTSRLDNANEGRGTTQMIEPLREPRQTKTVPVVTTAKPNLKAPKKKDDLIPTIHKLYEIVLQWNFYDMNANSPAPLPLTKIPNEFDSVEEYTKVFEPLLLAECQAQLVSCKSELSVQNTLQLTIKIVEEIDAFHQITFMTDGINDQVKSFSENDLIVISNEAISVIQGLRGPNNMTLLAKVQSSVINRPVENTSEFSVRVCIEKLSHQLHQLRQGSVWNAIKLTSMSTISREYETLKKVPQFVLCKDILNARQNEGKYDSAYMNQTYPGFNDSQVKAILAATSTKEGFLLIQGPPGTGKTTVILQIVKNVLRTQPRVLLCAPSNAAVDELVRRLLADTAVKRKDIVRLGTIEGIHPDAKSVTLDFLMSEQLQDGEEQSNFIKTNTNIDETRRHLDMFDQKMRSTSDAMSSLDPDTSDYKILQDQLHLLNQERRQFSTTLADLKHSKTENRQKVDIRRVSLRKELLQNARIICCTLSSSGHPALVDENLQFNYAIIDEAAQAVELSTLIPLRYGVKRCILVGDPNQLPPTVLSTLASKYSYEQSLFQRLFKTDQSSVQLLNTQHRMHPHISQLSSKLFYQNKLVDGVTEAQRTQIWHQHLSGNFPPFSFLNVSEGKQQRHQVRSMFNEQEAKVAVALYDALCVSNPDVEFSDKVGIITPYSQQRTTLKNAFAERYDKKILKYLEINTVDAFQGQEKEIIIFSCVRADPNKGIGFLSDVRRINVGITRARSSLFLLGHMDSLVSNDVWAEIVKYAIDKKALFSVSLPLFGRHLKSQISPNAYPEAILETKATIMDANVKKAPKPKTAKPKPRKKSPPIRVNMPKGTKPRLEPSNVNAKRKDRPNSGQTTENPSPPRKRGRPPKYPKFEVINEFADTGPQRMVICEPPFPNSSQPNQGVIPENVQVQFTTTRRASTKLIAPRMTAQPTYDMMDIDD